MLDFTLYPTYPHYRVLQRLTPMMVGFDVYALQTALQAVGFGVGASGADGYLGDDTARTIWAYQKYAGLTQDGKAGQQTQESLATKLAEAAGVNYALPIGLLYGQLMRESSMWLGNYSIQYANHTYDAGVAQRNTQQTPAKNGFTVPESVSVCAKHCRDYYNRYDQVSDTRRRWGLAAGAWNAPSWTDILAGEVSGTLTQTQRDQIEAYIASVTAYMVL